MGMQWDDTRLKLRGRAIVVPCKLLMKILNTFYIRESAVMLLAAMFNFLLSIIVVLAVARSSSHTDSRAPSAGEVGTGTVGDQTPDAWQRKGL